MVKSIDHIGIAVRSIEEQRAFYEDVLGACFEGEEIVAAQRVKVGFFRVGDVRIELLEPTDQTSTVATFLEKRGPGLHHLAYAVDDVSHCIVDLKARGVKMADDAPRPGAHSTQIAFMHPSSTFGVLTEICAASP